MATIDLKPVSEETIEEMGYTTHDLWFVKKEATVYGPFETLSLKHYSVENAQLFVDAVACLVDSQTWTTFFQIPEFAQPLQSTYERSEGPFWILLDGQKSAPLSKIDLQKKIEIGILSRTDLFSIDEGQTWHKLYEIPDFDHRHEPDQLPEVPTENSFQKAKLELVDKFEHSQGNAQQDGLASLAHLGQKKDKTIVLKLDEITLTAVQETDVSKSLKWAIPAMFGCFLTMSLTGWYFFGPKDDAPLPEVAEVRQRSIRPEVIMPPIRYQPTVNQNHISPTVQEMPIRRPASVPPVRPQERSVLTRSRSMPHSDFPTHMETHGDRSPSSDEREIDPRDVDQAPEKGQREEPSLVQQGLPGEEGHSSLDNEMNRKPANHDTAVDPPFVEEATDF